MASENINPALGPPMSGEMFTETSNGKRNPVPRKMPISEPSSPRTGTTLTSLRLWSRSTTMSSGSPGVLPWIAATTSSAVFT
jgi:hypothetical protein